MSFVTRSGSTQALAAIGLFAVLFVFWRQINTPEFLYNFVGNSGVCSAQQMVNFPSETDFVALGSSRVRRGISPETMTEVSGGLIQHPMNLGRGGFVPFRNLSMLRDALSRENSIRYIYFEVNIRALLGQYSRTRLFLDKAQFALVAREDYTTLSSVLRDLPAPERFRALLMLEFLKIKHGLVILFTGTSQNTLAQLGKAAPDVCWLPAFDVQRQRHVEKINRTKRRNVREFGPLDVATRDLVIADTWAAAVELNLLAEIRDLAESNNIELVIARPSAVYEPPLSDETVARIKLLVPEFEQPPAELIRESWNNYYDLTHMDTLARTTYTTWLAEIFVNRTD